MAGNISALKLVFSKRKYAILFAALALVLVPAYAILTGTVFLSPFRANPNIKPLEASLIFTVSLLASLGFTIAAFQLLELRTISKKSAGAGIIGAGAGGSILGAFASTCAVCQPAWLFWLGFGSASAFLTDYSLPIALGSIAILLYSIRSGLRAVSQCGCAPAKKKAGRQMSIRC